MDDYTKKIEAQIEKNNELIAEAKQTIEEMKAFFKTMGADLESGHNVFLESKDLSDEDRKQAEEIIKKFEQEFEEKYQEYRETTRSIPGDQERPETLKKAMEADQLRYRTEQAKKPKRGIRKMRL